MAKQKNVEAQNLDVKNQIKECALKFRTNNELPRALVDCFEALGIDTKRDILISYDRLPVGGPSVPYTGSWLTEQLQFLDFEIYLDPQDEFLVEIMLWKNVTEIVDVSEKNRGTGKSRGWIAIEALRELNSESSSNTGL